MISEELAIRILSFLHEKIYRILTNEVGLDVPEHLELSEANLEIEGSTYYFTYDNEEEVYSAFIDDTDGLSIGYNYISTIFAIREDSTTSQYEKAKMKEKYSRSQIDKYGTQNLRNALRDVLNAEIKIEETIYTFHNVSFEINENAYYSSGFEDLTDQAKAFSVSIEYIPL